MPWPVPTQKLTPAPVDIAALFHSARERGRQEYEEEKAQRCQTQAACMAASEAYRLAFAAVIKLATEAGLGLNLSHRKIGKLNDGYYLPYRLRGALDLSWQFEFDRACRLTAIQVEPLQLHAKYDRFRGLSLDETRDALVQHLAVELGRVAGIAQATGANQ